MAVISRRSGMNRLAAMPRRSRHAPLAGIFAAAAVGMAATAAAGGLTLLVRRLAGGFEAAPPAALNWLVAAAGIALVAAVDAAGRVPGPAGSLAWLASGLARLGLVAAAVAMLPTMSGIGWAERLASLAALLVAATAVVAPRPARLWTPPSNPARKRRAVSAPPVPPAAPVPQHRSDATQPPEVCPLPLAPPLPLPPPAGFRQRLERFETAAGEDCIRGQAILAVSTGSRTGHAHVGFCPSFASVPMVEATTDYDGVEAELIVAEVLPWGVRLECRLAEPAEEPLDIPVDFLARLTP